MPVRQLVLGGGRVGTVGELSGTTMDGACESLEPVCVRVCHI